MITPIEISTYTLCIVGAKYNLPSDFLRKWLAKLVGTEISIKVDERNVCDPFAVAAWAWIGDDPKKIGFVRSEDRGLAYRLLMACGSKRLVTKVTKIIGDQGTFIVGVSDITPVSEDALELVPKWEEWTTKVPPMSIPDDFDKEDFAFDEVKSLLQKGMDVDKDLLRKRLESYIKLSNFDISLETRKHREFIKTALRERKDADEWKDERSELRCQSGQMGNSTSGGQIWKVWIGFIKYPNFTYAFKTGKMPTKDEVEADLINFPLDMWNTWENSQNQFVSRLYYACIPRKVLWRFISALAYHEMLTSTTATMMLLKNWTDQSAEMPDDIVESLYKSVSWLAKKQDNNIPCKIINKLEREIEERKEIAEEKKLSNAMLEMKHRLPQQIHIDQNIMQNMGETKHE